LLLPFQCILFDTVLVIPISANQDTIGPMVRSMSDAAIVLSIIAGPDPNDNFTLAQPNPVPDYTLALNKTALAGKRIGVPRRGFTDRIQADVLAAFESALDTIKSLGATVVDPADLPDIDEVRRSGNESVVLDTDFKVCNTTSVMSVSGSLLSSLGPNQRVV